MHGVVCTVGKHRPCPAIDGCLYLVLIEEGGIFELRPYLIELHHFAEVYLKPLVVLLRIPVGMASLPEGAVVVVDGILRLEPFVVIAAGSDLGAKGEILWNVE